MKHVFPLYPISRMTFTLLLVAAATFLIPVVAVWWRPPAPGAAASVAITLTVLFAPLAALFASFAFVQRRSTIVVTDRNVTLKIPIYGRTMELDRLIPDSLRKVTMKDPERYRLTLRTNGLSVPGYQLGWFRTRGAAGCWWRSAAMTWLCGRPVTIMASSSARKTATASLRH